MADQDNVVKCSPRTLKTIGNHALTYHENYVNIDLTDLAYKFAKVKKIRVEQFARSLPSALYAVFESSLGSVNIRRAASAIISSLPVCIVFNFYYQFTFQATHLFTPDLGDRFQAAIHSAGQRYDRHAGAGCNFPPKKKYFYFSF